MKKIANLAIFAVLLSALLSVTAQADNISIVAIDALDNGALDDTSASTPSVDIVQGSCGSSAEPFNDTLLRIKVSNTSNAAVRFKRIEFVIPNPYGVGGKLRTRKFAPVGSVEVRPSESEDSYLYALFLDTSATLKKFAGESQTIPNDLGFRSIRIVLSGRDELERRVSISARTTLSFDDFDRCSS